MLVCDQHVTKKTRGLDNPSTAFWEDLQEIIIFWWGETMDFRFSDFSLNQSLDISSGYVNIAIENDHRHSWFTYYSNGGSFQFANRKRLPGRVSKIGENQPRGKHKQFDPENHWPIKIVVSLVWFNPDDYLAGSSSVNLLEI